MSLIDLTGRRFGRLIVAERAPDSIQENGRHRIMWKCQCDCGNSVICYGDNLNVASLNHADVTVKTVRRETIRHTVNLKRYCMGYGVA